MLRSGTLMVINKFAIVVGEIRLDFLSSVSKLDIPHIGGSTEGTRVEPPIMTCTCKGRLVAGELNLTIPFCFVTLHGIVQPENRGHLGQELPSNILDGTENVQPDNINNQPSQATWAIMECCIECII